MCITLTQFLGYLQEVGKLIKLGALGVFLFKFFTKNWLKQFFFSDMTKAQTSPALNGPSAKGSVYQSLKAQAKAPGVYNQDVALVELVRESHPDSYLTISSRFDIDLDGFAKAGHATQKFFKDPTTGFMADRDFMAPISRISDEQGSFRDCRNFALQQYNYDGVEYLIYEVYSLQRNDTSHKYYILSPSSSQEVDQDGDYPLNDKLIKAVTQWSRELHDEIYVYDSCWCKSSRLFKTVQNSSWDDVILDPSTKASIINDINAFFRNRALYKDLNVPWKRGIILHGPAGNGKTITIKALMNELGNRKQDAVPSLYVKSFENENGSQYAIQNIFQQARLMAPCLLIFEDLDSLVTDELRSYFLNEVDGLESNDGILMIGSTNHLGKLDPAIAKRPSRFDRKYGFGLPNADQRLLYAKYWRTKFERNLRVNFNADAAEFFAKITEGFSFAYMKELFVTSLMITVGEAGDQIETELNANKESIEKDASEQDSRKAKNILKDVEVPKELAENKFVQILHKQAAVLHYEMDSTTDEEGKVPIKGKLETQD